MYGFRQDTTVSYFRFTILILKTFPLQSANVLAQLQARAKVFFCRMELATDTKKSLLLTVHCSPLLEHLYRCALLVILLYPCL